MLLLMQEHGQGRALPAIALLIFTTSTHFPPWPSQDKGLSPQQVFPSGFYYKEGSRASQPPPPAQPPQAWSQSQHWLGVLQGEPAQPRRVASHRNRMGDFFFFRTLGVGGWGGVLCQVCLFSGTVLSSVVVRAPGDPSPGPLHKRQLFTVGA